MQGTGTVGERPSSYRQLIGGKNDEYDDSDSDFDDETIPGFKRRKTRFRLHKCLVVTLVLIVLLIVVIAISIAASKMTSSGTVPINENGVINVTNTTCGLVEGSFKDEVFVFKGIPYAAPPVGSRRWQAPAKLEEVGRCWGNNTFKAVEFGSKCAQWNILTKKYEGSEDCLYLNIWTTTLDTEAQLPVMFYIHGGSLIIRSGNEPEDKPTPELAIDTNMVYVSINYRLNAFGYLALKALSDASPNKSSGNYGFMDQIAALQWVKENIEQFGGDPNRVTVYGQSSGATSIFVLLASPLTDGLFKNAWALSGSANFVNSSLEMAEKNNEVFLNKTKCKEIADPLPCLKNLTAEEVVDAVPFDEFPSWNPPWITDLPVKSENYGSLAIVDGYVLKQNPYEVWKSGKKRDIQILLGTTAQEVEYFLVQDAVRSWNQSAYEGYVYHKLNTFGENISSEAISLYYDPSKNMTPEYQYATMATDIRVTCASNELGKALTNLTTEISRYIVTNNPSQPVELVPGHAARYALHGLDVMAFTGSIDRFIKSPTPSDVNFKYTIREVVKKFVKEELKWDDNFPNVLALLDEDYKLNQTYHEEQCNFWKSHGISQNYAWKN